MVLAIEENTGGEGGAFSGFSDELQIWGKKS